MKKTADRVYDGPPRKQRNVAQLGKKRRSTAVWLGAFAGSAVSSLPWRRIAPMRLRIPRPFQREGVEEWSSLPRIRDGCYWTGRSRWHGFAGRRRFPANPTRHGLGCVPGGSRIDSLQGRRRSKFRSSNGCRCVVHIDPIPRTSDSRRPAGLPARRESTPGRVTVPDVAPVRSSRIPFRAASPAPSPWVRRDNPRLHLS